MFCKYVTQAGICYEQATIKVDKSEPSKHVKWMRGVGDGLGGNYFYPHTYNDYCLYHEKVVKKKMELSSGADSDWVTLKKEGE